MHTGPGPGLSHGRSVAGREVAGGWAADGEGRTEHRHGIDQTHRGQTCRHPGVPSTHQVVALHQPFVRQLEQLARGCVHHLLQLAAHPDKLLPSLRHNVEVVDSEVGGHRRELAAEISHHGSEEQSS